MKQSKNEELSSVKKKKKVPRDTDLLAVYSLQASSRSMDPPVSGAHSHWVFLELYTGLLLWNLKEGNISENQIKKC